MWSDIKWKEFQNLSLGGDSQKGRIYLLLTLRWWILAQILLLRINQFIWAWRWFSKECPLFYHAIEVWIYSRINFNSVHFMLGKFVGLKAQNHVNWAFFPSCLIKREVFSFYIWAIFHYCIILSRFLAIRKLLEL